MSEFFVGITQRFYDLDNFLIKKKKKKKKLVYK